MDPRQRPRVTKRRNLLLLLALPLTLVLVIAVAIVINAHRALEHATQAAASQGQLAFTFHALDPSSARSLGAESIAATTTYTAGTFFAGDLYLTGPSGLTILHQGQSSASVLRSGVELPPEPITSLTFARLRGASEPQLLLATRGAGLLLLQPGSQANSTVQQLLPAEADARDLTAVAALSSGDVLLGTRHGGVLLYDGTGLRPIRFTLLAVNPAALEVTALTPVDTASFLIGTRNSGVYYMHRGTVEHADTTAGLPDNQVESIALAPGSGSTRAFVGTPVGTAEFDLQDGSFRALRTLARGYFGNALAVTGGELVVGTLDQGIQQIPLSERGVTLHRASIAIGPAPQSALRVDAFLASRDDLYALADGALLRKAGTTWQPALPAAPAALTDRNVSALAFAPDGTLYIGYFDHGIDLLDPEGAIRHLEDDHLFCINRLAVDPERHTVAAATADGLVLFDDLGRPRQTLTRRDGLIADHVTDIAFTSNGTALATPAGITFVGPSGTESLYAFQGLVNNHVYTLANGEHGRLIAGTLGGLSILHADAVERNLTVSNSTLKHNWITALLPEAGGTTLVGTYGAGLERMDDQDRMTAIEMPAATPRNLVINPNALLATATHIYAGTLGHGMLVYSNSAGRWSAVTSGLPSLNVTAFASRNGQIYVGTENGLVRIPEANLP